MIKNIFIAIFICLVAMAKTQAQILVDEGQNEAAPATVAEPEKPKTGKGAAAEYFKAREKSRETTSEIVRKPDSSGGADRYLTLHMGMFVNDKSYRWGSRSHDTNVGTGMFGVTYRVGEWKSSMDLLLRAELLSYNVDGEHPLKLSFMPIIAFPDSRSDFPLYFGVGAGAGIFFKQVSDSSDLSIDYAVVMGSRFPHLFGDAGLFVETGVKGQFFLLSQGQQQGVYLLAGGVFVF